MLCPCTLCFGGNEDRSEKTVSRHLKLFGSGDKVLLSQFLATPEETEPDELLHKVLRVCLKRLQRNSADADVLTVKTGGRPLTLALVTTPSKKVKTIHEIQARKHTKSIDNIIQHQAVNSDKNGSTTVTDDAKMRIAASFVKNKGAHEKSYIANQCNLTKDKVELDPLHSSIFKHSVNLSYKKLREIRKVTKGSFKFACEEKMKKTQDFFKIPYESTTCKLEHKISKLAVQVDKSTMTSKVLKDSPMIYINAEFLLQEIIYYYKAAEMIKFGMFEDGSIKFKIFVDSDSSGTKILLNMLNIDHPNSPYHHYIMLLSTGPDTKYNMKVYFSYLNKSMECLRAINTSHPLTFMMSLDTKALWQVLGMPTSWGTYPCPFCYITQADLKIPLHERSKFEPRTMTECHKWFQKNLRETNLDVKLQSKYMNIKSEPLLAHAISGPQNDNAATLNWLVVPAVHINQRVGTDMFLEGLNYAREVDTLIADYAARGWVRYEDIGVKEGCEFHIFSSNLREGISNNSALGSGPTQEAYMKMCASIGTKPKAHFGTVLNGNDAMNFVKADLSPFWKKHIVQNRWISSDEKSTMAKKVATLKVVSDAYRKFFKTIGSTKHVEESDLDVVEKDMRIFLLAYRRVFKTLPPKVHYLEDHLIDQLKMFRWYSGIYNEQGGEATHQTFKQKLKNQEHVKNEEERFKAAVEQTTLNNLLRVRAYVDEFQREE